jgi:hypothetical protein
LGKNAAVGGEMDKLNALTRAGENHPMLADHVATAQNRKADIAGAAGPDIAVAGADAVILERNVTA